MSIIPVMNMDSHDTTPINADMINALKYILQALSSSISSSLYRYLLYLSIIMTNEAEATKDEKHIMISSMSTILSIIFL